MLKEKFYNPNPVKIGDKYVGYNLGTGIYVVGEIGINHNGDLELCKEIIDMAKRAGCDAVKFQKRDLNSVYTPEELAKPREIPKDIIYNGVRRGIFNLEEIARLDKGNTTNGDQKRILEFGEKEYFEIDKYCKEKGMTWFASPWDENSVDFLEKYNVPCYKIASALLTDKAFLKKVKNKRKPIVLSTGMSTSSQIRSAVNYLGGEENLILLHCTSTYPSKDEEIDLNVIKTMRSEFNCPIGYSGHEPGIWPTMSAMAIGACMIERHVTKGRSLYGSDQPASLEFYHLEKVCDASKRIGIMLGSYEKKVQESEKPIIEKIRKKIDF